MASAGGFGADASEAVKSTATPQVTGAAEKTSEATKAAEGMSSVSQGGAASKAMQGAGIPGGEVADKAQTAAEISANPALGLAKLGGQKAKAGMDKLGSAIDSAGESAKDAASEGAAEAAAGGLSEGYNPAESKTATPGAAGGGKTGLRAAQAGAAAAPAGAQVGMIMMILNYMKFMFQMIMAAITNLLSMIWGAIVAAAQAVAGFFMAVGSFIAGAVGGAVSAVAAAVTTGITTLATLALIVGAALGVVNHNTLARHDGPVVACGTNVTQAIAASVDGVDHSEQTLANAKTIYGVLSSWGMKDENIAGVLGNWSAESGIDPTGVETIYDEPFTLGSRKKAAEDAGFKAASVAPKYKERFPAIDLLGIGLGQWTNGRNTLLRDYAKSINKPWSDLETQLGFMISKDDPTRVGQIKSMIENKNEGADSVEASTKWFKDKWEGLTKNDTLQKRKDAASGWFAQMGGWEKDDALAHSILAQANVALNSASDQGVRNKLAECIGSKLNVDNSSLATAAISYAWPMYDDSKGNDGTHLYYWLHEQIFPGDRYFASCDRSVATAVRWSGSDDTYPQGGVSAQLSYLATSDKWKQLNWGGDKSKLQPGDVLLRSGGGVSHVVMYVGAELPEKIWGKDKFTPNAEIVSGSLNDRSPALGQWYGASSGHGTTSSGGSGLDTYTAYRLVKPETNSKYKTLAPPSSAKPGEGDKSRHNTPGPG